MENNGAFDPEADGLTAGEQHILALIREGRLDAEIAVRLGVPIGEVKERVQRILRKLELGERGELLAPVGVVENADSGNEAGEVVIGGPEPVPARTGWPVLVTRAGGGLVLLGAAIFAAMWAWSLNGPAAEEAGGDLPVPTLSAAAVPGALTAIAKIDATETAAASPAASPTPTQFAVTARSAPEMKVTELTTFPENLVLYVVNSYLDPNLYASAGVIRVYRLGGVTRYDRIFPLPGATTPVLAAAADADGSDIVVAVCTRGTCDSGTGAADSEATYYRSRDGGATWESGFSLPGGTGAMAVSGGRVLLEEATETRAVRWQLWENGVMRELTPPVKPGTDGVRPFLDSNGRVFWLTGTAVANEDGSIVFTLPRAGSANLVPGPFGWFMRWVAFGGSPTVTFSVSPAGNVLHAGTTTPGWLFPVAAVDNANAVGVATAGLVPAGRELPVGRAGSLPALIHLSSGVVEVLTEPFLESPFRGFTNYVVAARFGTFVRVNTPGGCLDVREDPSPGARFIACVPDGALLPDSGFLVDPAMLRVETPDGRIGWAASAYLER
ncbi:MAG: helix-turn-helix transcriptional regulator [Chloroflexi bacterium]|nr:helix-turn-helix transcriptional regulator [Chloroflexota bacterium]